MAGQPKSNVEKLLENLNGTSSAYGRNLLNEYNYINKDTIYEDEPNNKCYGTLADPCVDITNAFKDYTNDPSNIKYKNLVAALSKNLIKKENLVPDLNIKPPAQIKSVISPRIALGILKILGLRVITERDVYGRNIKKIENANRWFSNMSSENKTNIKNAATSLEELDQTGNVVVSAGTFDIFMNNVDMLVQHINHNNSILNPNTFGPTENYSGITANTPQGTTDLKAYTWTPISGPSKIVNPWAAGFKPENQNYMLGLSNEDFVKSIHQNINLHGGSVLDIYGLSMYGGNSNVVALKKMQNEPVLEYSNNILVAINSALRRLDNNKVTLETDYKNKIAEELQKLVKAEKDLMYLRNQLNDLNSVLSQNSSLNKTDVNEVQAKQMIDQYKSQYDKVAQKYDNKNVKLQKILDMLTTLVENSGSGKGASYGEEITV